MAHQNPICIARNFLSELLNYSDFDKNIHSLEPDILRVIAAIDVLSANEEISLTREQIISLSLLVAAHPDNVELKIELATASKKLKRLVRHVNALERKL